MDDYLHTRTIFVVVSMIGLILLICMAYVAKTRKTYNGFQYWTLSSAFYFGGNFLFGFRGIWPDWISIVLANALITLLLWLIPYGITLFAERPHPLWPYLLPTVAVTVLISCFTYIMPSMNARIIVLSIMFAAMTIYAIVLYKRLIQPLLGGSNFLLAATFTCGTLWSVGRIVYTLFYEPNSASLLNTSVIQRASILIYCGLYVLVCISLCVLNFQRVEHDLTSTTEEVNQLKGILPICASCKKIRDDKGYWNQVELYVRNHSAATFTHSICPKCLKEMYPEYADPD